MFDFASILQGDLLYPNYQLAYNRVNNDQIILQLQLYILCPSLVTNWDLFSYVYCAAVKLH